MTSRVPSSSTESPGSAPVSSRPFRSHLTAGLGIPARKRGNGHKRFAQLRTRLIQTTPAACWKSCWKDNTWGGQELPRGSPSCYRMILTLKIFILNIVKSLLASNDFPQDFHIQWLFKSLFEFFHIKHTWKIQCGLDSFTAACNLQRSAEKDASVTTGDNQDTHLSQGTGTRCAGWPLFLERGC